MGRLRLCWSVSHHLTKSILKILIINENEYKQQYIYHHGYIYRTSSDELIAEHLAGSGRAVPAHLCLDPHASSLWSDTRTELHHRLRAKHCRHYWRSPGDYCGTRWYRNSNRIVPGTQEAERRACAGARCFQNPGSLYHIRRRGIYSFSCNLAGGRCRYRCIGNQPCTCHFVRPHLPAWAKLYACLKRLVAGYAAVQVRPGAPCPFRAWNCGSFSTRSRLHCGTVRSYRATFPPCRFVGSSGSII